MTEKQSGSRSDGLSSRYTGKKSGKEPDHRTDRQIVTETDTEKSTCHFQMENGDKMKGKSI